MKYFSFNIIFITAVILFFSCEYSDQPYRKERLIKVDDTGYITKYYFPLGRTDSVRIYFEDLTGNYNYETPIAEYSMRNTNYDFMFANIDTDTIKIYYRNSNLKITSHIGELSHFFIKFKHINKKSEIRSLKDSLKINIDGIEVLHYNKEEGVWSDSLPNPFKVK